VPSVLLLLAAGADAAAPTRLAFGGAKQEGWTPLHELARRFTLTAAQDDLVIEGGGRMTLAERDGAVLQLSRALILHGARRDAPTRARAANAPDEDAALGPFYPELSVTPVDVLLLRREHSAPCACSACMASIGPEGIPLWCAGARGGGCGVCEMLSAMGELHAPAPHAARAPAAGATRSRAVSAASEWDMPLRSRAPSAVESDDFDTSALLSAVAAAVEDEAVAREAEAEGEACVWDDSASTVPERADADADSGATDSGATASAAAAAAAAAEAVTFASPSTRLFAATVRGNVTVRKSVTGKRATRGASLAGPGSPSVVSTGLALSTPELERENFGRAIEGF
jgi:hypothetical protein